MKACTICGVPYEELYEFGNDTPIDVQVCLCTWEDVGVSDREFEEYRQKIINDLP